MRHVRQTSNQVLRGFPGGAGPAAGGTGRTAALRIAPALLAFAVAAACGSATPEPASADDRDPASAVARTGGERVQPTEAHTDPLTDLPMLPVPSRPGAPSIGPETAPLQVVVFTDFQCPYCRMHAEALQQLIAHYGDRVRVVVRQFPLAMHPMAQMAAEAALAAQAEGRFWKFHDLLFGEPAITLSREALVRIAQQVGLDMSRFERAIDSGFFAGIVDKDVRDGEALGVTGTPTTFINGRRVSGALGLERLLEICDQILGGGP